MSGLLLLLEAEEKLLPPTPQTSHPRQSTATSWDVPCCDALQPQGNSARASVFEYGKLSTLRNPSEGNKKGSSWGGGGAGSTGSASSVAGRDETQTQEEV